MKAKFINNFFKTLLNIIKNFVLCKKNKIEYFKQNHKK